jgi:hypothetical protein
LFDVVVMGSESDRKRLSAYASGGHDRPLPGFWSSANLAAP